MTAPHRLLAAALAAVFALSLAACGGDDKLAPDLLLVSTRDGDYAIYSLNTAGGGAERLTDGESDPSTPEGLYFQIDPAWSPDDSKIVFASKRSGSFDLYTMNADGTGTQRLTSTSEDDEHPTWSPDGGLIAFARGTPSDIYVMRADGSGARRLGTDQAVELQPAWSPDGLWIAYVRQEPGTSVRELWLQRPDGTAAHQLTSLTASSYSPAWSPESSRIAFSTDAKDTQFDIYSIGFDGKELRRVTKTTADSIEPSWSPDGKTIAFSEDGAIATVEAGGGEVRELTDRVDNDSSPTWKPLPVQGEG